MQKLLEGFVSDECGQDLVEYALLAALVGCISIGAIDYLSASLSNSFVSLGKAMDSFHCAAGQSCAVGH
jgi:pilus assembly protein Flp/PilA